MIELTRTLLGGSAAAAMAGMVSFRARSAARTYHALLVACTDYDNLPKKAWLIGPKHDAGLVRDYFVNNAPAPAKFETDNITLLAKMSRTPAASPPMRRSPLPSAVCDAGMRR